MTKNDKLDRAIEYLETFSPIHGNSLSFQEVVKNLESLKTKHKEEKPKKQYSLGVINCFNNCIRYFPYYLHPKDPKKWYDVIDKLNRIDEVEFKEIERVVAAVRANDFWSKNFQSMVKLRKVNRDMVQYFISFQDKFPVNNTVTNRNFAKDSTFD